jgi:hypothetical protein
MEYEWKKKTMGYFFGMCPSLVSNTAGKFPLFTSMILRKFGWFFEAFLGQDVQLVFFWLLGK